MTLRQIGAYRVRETLGEGGMGTVYRATDEMLDREVAVKTLRPELTRNAELVARFRQEAKILARLSHPGIATLYGLVKDGADLFMVMELVAGETLDHAIRRHGRVPWPRAAAIAGQALDALDYAHRRGVVHRDLKPANVMLTGPGGVKLMDFGIARLAGTSRHTRAGRVVGTLAYMAPEQIRGEEGDARSDVYALGVVLFEMLTGAVPFDADSDFSLMQKVLEAEVPFGSLGDAVPAWLAAVAARALAKAPDDRFQTAAAFRAALDAGARAPAAEPKATRLADAEPAARSIKETRLAGGSEAAAGLFAAAPRRAPRLPRVTPIRLSMAAAGLAVAALLVATGLRVWTGPAANAAPPAAAARTDILLPLRPSSGGFEPVASLAMTPPAPPVARPYQPPAPRPPAARDDRREAGRAGGAPSAEVPVRTPAGDDRLASDRMTPATPAPEADAGAVEVAFDRVKLLVPDGDDSREVDVVLEVYRDRLSLRAADGADVLKELRFRRMGDAVYSQSKHPRWKEGAAAAVAVGILAAPVFFMKGTRHWLTMEEGGMLTVLRLDKRNYETILATLQAKLGRPVER